MLFNLWRFIQLLLPYWVVIHIYKSNRCIPANIRTRSGRNLSAIMVTDNYGVLFSDEKYVKDRVEKLKQQQLMLNTAMENVLSEINNLSFEVREQVFGGDNE